MMRPVTERKKRKERELFRPTDAHQQAVPLTFWQSFKNIEVLPVAIMSCDSQEEENQSKSTQSCEQRQN